VPLTKRFNRHALYVNGEIFKVHDVVASNRLYKDFFEILIRALR
jgi:hypothetical protein